MLKPWIGILVVVSLFGPFSHAASGKPSDKSKTAITLDDLVRQLLKSGQDNVLGKVMGEHLGIPGGCPTKGVGVSRDAAADGLQHLVNVCIRKSAQGAVAPIGVILMINARDFKKKTDTSYFIKVSLKGELEAALTYTDRLGPDNKVVAYGKGTIVTHDTDDPRLRKTFQHEMNFWLKGMYRK